MYLRLHILQFDVEIVVESGDARGFIPLMCDKLAADTLVMGSRGLGGLKRCATFVQVEVWHKAQYVTLSLITQSADG